MLDRVLLYLKNGLMIRRNEIDVAWYQYRSLE